MKLLISNIILLLIFSASVSANTEPIFKADYDKVIEKEFPLNADGTFEAKNKYGAININTWDKNSVSIKVIIEVKTKSEAKANKIFEKIEINFSDDPRHVKAETDLESGNWDWGKNEEFQINYEVNMPSSAHLKLSNKYGNSYIAAIENGADIWISYGNISIETIKGKTNAEISYGNLNFKMVDHLDINAKYAMISGESIGNLEIESKYSQIKIKTAGNIDSKTNYDHFNIETVGNFVNAGKYDNVELGEVGNVDLENGYGNLQIGLLHTDLTVEQKYGNINIESIDCEKGEIDLETEYVTVTIGLNECDNVNVDIKGDHTSIKVPSDMDGDIRHDGVKSKLKAKYGNGGKTIEASMKFGSLKIK